MIDGMLKSKNCLLIGLPISSQSCSFQHIIRLLSVPSTSPLFSTRIVSVVLFFSAAQIFSIGLFTCVNVLHFHSFFQVNSTWLSHTHTHSLVIINRLKIPRSLSTPLPHRQSELPSKGEARMIDCKKQQLTTCLHASR